MPFIKADSIAPAARDWLANSRYPQILHVFDHVCNLINEHRDVLSVVTRHIGNGPFNLVIEGEVLFSDYLWAQSPVSIRSGQLRLGDLAVGTDGTKRWPSCPDWGRLHANKDELLDQLISLPSIDHQPLLPDFLISDLSTAIACADIPSCLATTSQLAGLGNGLTPAGDDYILGAVLAAWIVHPAEVARVLAEEITNTAVPLTTSLSAAWLRAAGKGEAGILWHGYFDALISANSVAIHKTMNKILAVGATSGADALAGFRAVFLSWAELASPQTP